jgi:hypothetical protein
MAIIEITIPGSDGKQPVVEIKVPGSDDKPPTGSDDKHPTKTLKGILKALNLLLRIGEINMQAIADFGVAQRAFHQRMDAAMQQIKDNMSAGGTLSEEDQRILNELHLELEARTTQLEEMANQMKPVPPVV